MAGTRTLPGREGFRGAAVSSPSVASCELAARRGCTEPACQEERPRPCSVGFPLLDLRFSSTIGCASSARSPRSLRHTDLFSTCARWPLSQRRDNRREFDIRSSCAVRVELGRIQEHHAALATCKELGLVPRTVLPHHRDAVKAFIATYSATPSAARDGKGSGHRGIVVTLWRRCPRRSKDEWATG